MNNIEERYTKLDWWHSPKVLVNINENETKVLKLSGFKYSQLIMPVMIGFLVLYLLFTYVFDMRWNYIVFIPASVLLYLSYFVTFGENRYFRLTE